MTDQDFELLIFLLVGVFLFVWGYYKHSLYKKLIRFGIKTEGTIVDIKVDIDDGAGTYFPVISYNSINNGEIIKRYDIGSNPSPFRIGDSVTIFYDQEDNRTFVIENKNSKFLGPILIIAGLVVAILCIIQYFFPSFIFIQPSNPKGQ